MDSERWQRIQQLFHDATALPPAARLAFVQADCGDDEKLVSDVMAMLEEDARSTSVLDRDLAGMAHQLLEKAASAALPEQKFGPYALKQVLGEGGMGVVYLAMRGDLGSVVAIKVLRDAWLSPARRERFAIEQRTLAQLNHPSIARLYDAETLEDGTPWFAMEYVEGLPLTEYCRQRCCSMEQRLRLFRAVCEAAQYAHRHAVIHRDLKPSNILVKNDGSVRLLDFGIAKHMESIETPANQTLTGLRLMTPAYAAPEQMRGERVGMHTDVYALGVMLYELLAGQLPFDLAGKSPAEAERAITEQEPERPSAAAARRSGPEAQGFGPALGKAAWADLDVLCRTAMHRDAQRRYRSVEALMRDVDLFLAGQPLEAREDTFNYRLGKFARRNRRAVTAAAAALVTFVAMVVFFTMGLTRARDAALAQTASTQRIQRFLQNLFEGGDEVVGPADTLRVITLLDRGVQEAQALTGEPALQAEMYHTLGTIYTKLGKFEQADSLLKSALERRKTLLGVKRAEVAESLVALGTLRDAQGQFEEAERLTREAVGMSRQHLAAEHPAIPRALGMLGQILNNRGKYDEAIPALEEAVRLQSAAGGASPELAASLSELANVNFYAGNYDEAERLNQRVLVMSRQLYGERHPLVADDLINLGAVQFERTRYPEAEKFYREGLEIIQAWYGKDHYRTAAAMTMLGRALIPQNKEEEAAAVMREALRVQEQVFGPVHPRVASALNEIGLIALRQKRLDEAEASFRRMADVYKAVHNDKHYVIGIALSNLAGVHHERKEYVQAEGLLREVLRRYGETLAADHQLAGIARIRLGRSLVFQRRFGDGEQESRAGYQILMKQSTPAQRWLNIAREDLATAYDALVRPADATRMRAEIAESNSKGSPAAAKK